MQVEVERELKEGWGGSDRNVYGIVVPLRKWRIGHSGLGTVKRGMPLGP